MGTVTEGKKCGSTGGVGPLGEEMEAYHEGLITGNHSDQCQVAGACFSAKGLGSYPKDAQD